MVDPTSPTTRTSSPHQATQDIPQTPQHHHPCLRRPDPKSRAAPTLHLASGSSYFPAFSLSNTRLSPPCRRTLRVSCQNHTAQWPAISSVPRKVAAGSCSGSTIGKCSSSDLVGEGAGCRRTSFVSESANCRSTGYVFKRRRRRIAYWHSHDRVSDEKLLLPVQDQAAGKMPAGLDGGHRRKHFLGRTCRTIDQS